MPSCVPVDVDCCSRLLKYMSRWLFLIKMNIDTASAGPSVFMHFAYTSPCVSKCAFMRLTQIAASIILHFRRLSSAGLSALKCWLIYKHAMFRASPCVSKCAFMPSCRCESLPSCQQCTFMTLPCQLDRCSHPVEFMISCIQLEARCINLRKSRSLHAFLSMCTSIECCFRPFGFMSLSKVPLLLRALFPVCAGLRVVRKRSCSVDCCFRESDERSSWRRR